VADFVGSKIETAVGAAGRGIEGGDWVVGESDPSATFHFLTEAESLQPEKKREEKKEENPNEIMNLKEGQGEHGLYQSGM